jgi:hypothetical protein
VEQKSPIPMASRALLVLLAVGSGKQNEVFLGVGTRLPTKSAAGLLSCNSSLSSLPAGCRSNFDLSMQQLYGGSHIQLHPPAIVGHRVRRRTVVQQSRPMNHCFKGLKRLVSKLRIAHRDACT